MKLSAYIVKFDFGFAPNPYGHHCTLACCKPTIRRNAEVGDIIVGIAASRLERPGHLIFAMRVKEVLSFKEYWADPRFASRIPSLATPVSRLGDNIWHCNAKGEWQVVPGAIHDESSLEHDTSGENALVATEFFYFGREAIPVPRKFSQLLASTQGHKNTHDTHKIDAFWDWLSRTASKGGRIGDPSEVLDDESLCRCREIEGDDILET